MTSKVLSWFADCTSIDVSWLSLCDVIRPPVVIRSRWMRVLNRMASVKVALRLLLRDQRLVNVREVGCCRAACLLPLEMQSPSLVVGIKRVTAT